MSRLTAFLAMPLSRRLQSLGFRFSRLRTWAWYRPRMVACGRGTLIGTPLFWTPEHVSAGRDVLVWPGARIEGIPPTESGSGQQPLITLGDGVILQQACHITAAGPLDIGAGTLMSFNVSIQDTDHRYDDLKRSVSLQPLTYRSTRIGRNCFLGARVSIQAGSQLGDHCIVGANAVVRGEFPAHCVLVGAPARAVKRYDPSTGTWKRTDPAGAFLADLS